MMPVRVLVADASPSACRVIDSFLASEPGIEVVGQVRVGPAATEAVARLRPDVVTLGLQAVGGQEGALAALAEIARDRRMPVIVVTGAGARAAEATSAALRSGAVDFVLKYVPGIATDPGALRRELVGKVRSAARLRPPRQEAIAVPQRGPVLRSVVPADELGALVVLGASTGGPMVLREILARLPVNLPAAVLVVQHLPAAFTGVLAAQLAREVPFPVREAEDGDVLRNGEVLVAPGGRCLEVERDLRVRLRPARPDEPHSPAVNAVLESAAAALGSRVHGLVLTGMGEDGAYGLAAVREAGGRTYAQDAASCVVAGMPERARELGVVETTGTPAALAAALCEALLPAEGRREPRTCGEEAAEASGEIQCRP